jgi:hypothetical protein
MTFLLVIEPGTPISPDRAFGNVREHARRVNRPRAGW